MKTLGLVGGMSWESTAIYYRLMNEAVQKELGDLHSAKLLIWSFDFAEIARLQATGEWDKAADEMVKAGSALKAAGADGLVICTNTMHKLADTLTQHVDLPLIHIADTTAAAIQAQKVQKAALLATRFTMEQDFYTGRLKAQHGIETIVPNDADRKIVHDIIYNELCKGMIKESSRTAYNQIIEKMIAQGAQGIILGCTEICMLINQEHVRVPVFDTTHIHATQAVKWALDCPGNSTWQLAQNISCT
ncbi:MAG: aspartate/glutamate racemase family protein [Alphaproteobacteria bacterium]